MRFHEADFGRSGMSMMSPARSNSNAQGGKPSSRRILTSPKIPFYTQRVNFDTPWLEGFRSVESAQYWQERAGGIACLRMIIDGLTKPAMQTSYGALVYEAVNQGAYGKRGWTDEGLVELARQAGVCGKAVRKASPERLVDEIEADNPCIASVSLCFRGGQVGSQGNRIPPGGHLVVVLGAAITDGAIDGFIVHHPSSSHLYDWERKFIPMSSFGASFSGSYMSFWC